MIVSNIVSYTTEVMLQGIEDFSLRDITPRCRVEHARSESHRSPPPKDESNIWEKGGQDIRGKCKRLYVSIR